MADDINTVVESMDQLTTTTLRAGIEFTGFTKKITQVAASTEGAGKAWTTFSRLVSGTPLWAFQNKMRAYLSIIAGFETRSKANTKAAIEERKQMVAAIVGYQKVSNEMKEFDKAAVKATNSNNNVLQSLQSINVITARGDGFASTALQLEENLEEAALKRYDTNNEIFKLKLKALTARGREGRLIDKEIEKQTMIRDNALAREKSISRTVELVKNLDKKQLAAIKNTVEYQQTLLATDDENLAIRRGRKVLKAKMSILDKEQKMRVHNAKLAYAQDEERVKMAIEKAKEIVEIRKSQGQKVSKFESTMLKRKAEKDTRKKMKGEMNELAGVELGNALDSMGENLKGSLKNMIPLLAPLGALLKVSKLSLSALNLRSMTAAKFQIFVLKFVQKLAPIMKMMMMYLIYAILFIIAAAVIFKYLKEFYDILKRFGVIEEIKEFGMQAWSVALTFFKAIKSFFAGDYQKGLDYVITGAEKLGKLVLVGLKLALKIGFLAMVAGFGMAMKFIKALATSEDLQRKVGKLLMYVGLAIAAVIVAQILIGMAITALAFLALPALIITGLLAAMFAVAYYFGDELQTFADYFAKVLEGPSMVLTFIGEATFKFFYTVIGLFIGWNLFILSIPSRIYNLLLLVLDKAVILFMSTVEVIVKYFLEPIVSIAIKVQETISNIKLPKVKIPFMADGGVSKGGMTVVGERGPELVNLSKGSRVFSNSESRKMVSSSGTVNNFNITINAKDTSKAEMRRIANELGNMINNKMNRTGATRTMR